MKTRKQFIQKHYEQAFDEYRREQEKYGSELNEAELAQKKTEFNNERILNEVLAYFLYDSFVNVPKVYVTQDEVNKNYLLLYSQMPEVFQTLREYLADRLNLSKEQITYSTLKQPEYTQALQNSLNQIEGLGRLMFLALWLFDNDVLGDGLSNVLLTPGATDSKAIFKIDPGEAKLTTENALSLDDYKFQLNSLKNQNDFLPHISMPFFNLIFSLLSDKQKEEGIIVINSIPPDKIKELLDVANHLKTKAPVGKKIDLDEIILTLQQRRSAILENFLTPDLESKIIPIAIRQNINILRSIDHFSQPVAKIHGGTAAPNVVKKYNKLERTLIKAKELITLLVKQIENKIQQLGDQPEKQEKLNILSNLNIAVKKSLKEISILLRRENLSSEEINTVFTNLDDVIQKNIEAIKKDPSEFGKSNQLKLSVSTFFKRATEKLGVSSNAEHASIYILERFRTEMHNNRLIPEKISSDHNSNPESIAAKKKPS